MDNDEVFSAVEAPLPVFVPVVDNFGSRYSSPREAARVLGLRIRDIEQVLAGQLASIGGFRFTFEGVR